MHLGCDRPQLALGGGERLRVPSSKSLPKRVTKKAVDVGHKVFPKELEAMSKCIERLFDRVDRDWVLVGRRNLQQDAPEDPIEMPKKLVAKITGELNDEIQQRLSGEIIRGTEIRDHFVHNRHLVQHQEVQVARQLPHLCVSFVVRSRQMADRL